MTPPLVASFAARTALSMAVRRGSLTRGLALTMTMLLLGPLLLIAAVVGPSDATNTHLTATVAASDQQQVAAAPPALRPLVLAAARAYALPPALLVAVAEVESGFDPTAVGPPVRSGPAQGLMQFLPSSWVLFNVVPGATPFQPGPALLAGANHLLSSGRLPGGAWDAARGLFGYNRSAAYVTQVLALAARYGMQYRTDVPPLSAARYAFPVVGPTSYGPDHHDYPATDVFASIGQPVVACVRAEVVATHHVETGKGGITVTLRGEDGFRYYYAHLSSLRPDLTVGRVVEAGEPLGTNGQTGNARSTPPHLHLGISRTGSVAGEISPYPYLRTWEGRR